MHNQEKSIQVDPDDRGFYEKIKEMLISFAIRYSSDPTLNTSSTSNDNFNNDNDWELDIKDWINRSVKCWGDEISRIKRSMLCLEPIDGGGSHSTIVEKAYVVQDETESEVVKKKNHDPQSSNDAYVMSEDKRVHFKILIQTSGFKSEDIKLVARDNEIIVRATKEIVTKDEKRLREFGKIISVPQIVDVDKFLCHQTKDGILILEAPIKEEEHFAKAYNESLGVVAVWHEDLNVSNSIISVTGKPGPLIIDDPIDGRKIHFEITVGSDYELPDFSVQIEKNQIHIKGRHEVNAAKSKSFKEFSTFYEVTENINAKTVKFHLIDGTLVVEAPLSK